jgi:hypothetical protein
MWDLGFSQYKPVTIIYLNFISIHTKNYPCAITIDFPKNKNKSNRRDFFTKPERNYGSPALMLKPIWYPQLCSVWEFKIGASSLM